jgi:hypothetical protein
MKKLIFFPLLLLAFAGFSQTSKLTVYYKFMGIEKGYDHDCKTQVYVDGEFLGESEVAPQSKAGTFAVNVPQGQHNLRIVNLALYEGVWEEHTVENNYSVDCLYETDRTFKSKPEKLYLVFDLDDETMASWKKPVKKKKK